MAKKKVISSNEWDDESLMGAETKKPQVVNCINETMTNVNHT